MPRPAVQAAVAALALGLCWLIAGTLGARAGYDSSWHVIWAQDLLAGRSPSLDAWAAPTEHPLLVAIALLAAPFGPRASQAMVALDLFALLLVCPALIRLTGACFGSRASGAVAWLVLAGAYGLLLAALRGYLDVWFVLLVVVAATRHAEHGGDGAGAIPIGLAGLLRPEGWLIAAAAAIDSMIRRDRQAAIRYSAATLVPPALWFGIDQAVTGNALLSIDTARTLALEGDGGGPIRVIAASLLGGVRGPATLLGAIGLVLAWKVVGLRRLRTPLAIGAIGLGSAAGIAILGLTVLPRYLMLAWLALSIFAGYAVGGWSSPGLSDSLRARWRVAGLCALVLGAVGAGALGAPAKLADEVAIDRSMGRDLGALLAEPSVRRGLECGPLTFPSFRLIPDAILVLDDRSIEVRGRALDPIPETGVAVVVTGGGETVAGRYSRPGIDLPVDEAVPAGFTPAGTSGDLSAFVRCSAVSR
ncbi:MAG: hypothetical protein WCO96_08425 [Actinomycetes bacterium]